jgi:hypothetical protein
MKKASAGLALASLAALAAAAGPGYPGMARQSLTAPPALLNLAKILPGPGDLRGWTPRGKPQIFKGEDLFLYIDGGAEIFHEYGFRQVCTQDYANAAGKTVTLDIYEMATPEGAFGMYTFKTGAGGTAVPIGRDGRLEDYYLNFWKGRCLATVVGPDASAESLDGIERVGKAAEAKIDLEGERPGLLAVLPKSWSAAGRTIYLKGILAVRNIYSFFARDAFLFREGVVSDQGPLKVFVLRYGDKDECAGRFATVRDAFRTASAYRNFQDLPGGIFEIADSKENRIFGAAFEDCLGLVINLGSQKAAADIFDLLRSRRAALPPSFGTQR